MAKHDVSRMVPSLFHPEIAARNGRLPGAAVFMRVARGYNQIATRQRKLIMCKWQNLRDMAGATGIVWPFYFRTGQNVEQLWVHAGITLRETASGSPATLSIPIVAASGGGPVNGDGQGSLTYAGTTAGTTVGADDISHKTFVISNLDPDTEYHGEFATDDGMRLAYATVLEVPKRQADDSVAVVCNPARFVREGPILASHLVDLNAAANSLWRHNAGHLFSWTANYVTNQGADPETSSTSYVDLIANTAAMHLATTNRGTLQRPNAIPVKMAVKATRTAGTGTADFRIFDGTNAVQILAAPITGVVTGGEWHTGTGTLSGTPATWRLQHRVSVGTTTVRTFAWSCFQFEA